MSEITTHKLVCRTFNVPQLHHPSTKFKIRGAGKMVPLTSNRKKKSLNILHRNSLELQS